MGILKERINTINKIILEDDGKKQMINSINEIVESGMSNIKMENRIKKEELEYKTKREELLKKREKMVEVYKEN